MPTVPGSSARELFVTGKAPANLRLTGYADLSNLPLRELPPELVADALDLSNCPDLRTLPPDLKVRRLNLSGCRGLEDLPPDFSCYELELRETRLATLPEALKVEYRLDLEGNTALTALPPGLKVGTLILRNCTSLTALPENLSVSFLDISGCTALVEWPGKARLQFGRLVARNCHQLKQLPGWINHLSQLDLRDCSSLQALPEKLEIGSWIDLAGTGVTELPHSLKKAELLWRGIPVDWRIVFQPETISVQEVLAEPNAEKRRVLMERVGYERFMREAGAEVLDQDRDPGGVRHLL
ncbi:MAG TPA: hypothetical protein VH186_29780 [Chloroflexia bacterium]|nr:hypothetical protein [Chloroflexia bacterium]